MKIVFFKGDPWLQIEGDHLESFDDANNSFLLAFLGWVDFKMLWFVDLFNLSRGRVFCALLPCDDDLSEIPKNASSIDSFREQARVLILSSRWCSPCLQKALKMMGSSWCFDALDILLEPWSLRAWVSLVELPFLDLSPYLQHHVEKSRAERWGDFFNNDNYLWRLFIFLN